MILEIKYNSLNIKNIIQQHITTYFFLQLEN